MHTLIISISHSVCKHTHRHTLEYRYNTTDKFFWNYYLLCNKLFYALIKIISCIFEYVYNVLKVTIQLFLVMEAFCNEEVTNQYLECYFSVTSLTGPRWLWQYYELCCMNIEGLSSRCIPHSPPSSSPQRLQPIQDQDKLYWLIRR